MTMYLAVALGLCLRTDIANEPVQTARAPIRVADCKSWGLRPPILSPNGSSFSIGSTYMWMSDRHILYLTDVELAQVALATRDTVVFQGWTHGGLPHRLDVATGESTLLDGLARVFRTTGVWSETVQASPDGKWVLWNAGDSWHVATVSGSGHVKLTSKLEWSWLSGNSSLAGIEENKDYAPKRLVLRDPAGLAKQVSVRLDEFSDKAHNVWSVLLDQRVVQVSALPGEQDIDEVRFEAVGLARPSPARYSWSVKLPFRATMHEMVPSADGKKIAWLIERDEDRDKFQRAANALPGNLYGSRQAAWDLWVSNTDGSDMRRQALPGPCAPMPIAEAPRHIRWGLDGRTLSCVYGDAVWTIDALQGSVGSSKSTALVRRTEVSTAK